MSEELKVTELEKAKAEEEHRELMAKAAFLERELHDERRNNEMSYLRGMVDGLKYSIRCNGVSGAEVEREREP